MAEIFVDGDLRPDTRIARVLRRSVFPAVGTELARLRNRVKNPEPLAGPHVEAAYVALHVRLAARRDAGQMRRADDDHVLRDHRRGVEPDVAGDQIDLLIVVLTQVHDAVVAEVLDRRPGVRVERDQPVARRDIHNPLAPPIAPVREPSPRKLSRRVRPALAFLIAVHPQELAAGGVQRDDRSASPGGRVQHAVDHQRRRLELELRRWAEVVGLEPPGNFEIFEVGRADLIERRVAPVRQVAAVGPPLEGGRRRRRLRTQQCERRDHDEAGGRDGASTHRGRRPGPRPPAAAGPASYEWAKSEKAFMASRQVIPSPAGLARCHVCFGT